VGDDFLSDLSDLSSFLSDLSVLPDLSSFLSDFDDLFDDDDELRLVDLLDDFGDVFDDFSLSSLTISFCSFFSVSSLTALGSGVGWRVNGELLLALSLSKALRRGSRDLAARRGSREGAGAWVGGA
jgi:hypothetical protein